MPRWARIGCVCGGAVTALAAPVGNGLPLAAFVEQPFAVSMAFLFATVAVLAALTPRRFTQSTAPG